MMKELREKGTGEEELAAAHAKWLEEQDSHMLKRLVRDVKRGFGKGRKRVQVCGPPALCRHEVHSLDEPVNCDRHACRSQIQIIYLLASFCVESTAG